MPPSKVELYAAIRRDARAGMSGRAMEEKYRVGRRTIVKALASAWPEPRKQLPPSAPASSTRSSPTSTSTPAEDTAASPDPRTHERNHLVMPGCRWPVAGP